MRKLFPLLLLAPSMLLCAGNAFPDVAVDDSDIAPALLETEHQREILQEGRLEGRVLIFPAQALPQALPSPAPFAGTQIYGTVVLADRQGQKHPARGAQVSLVGSKGAVAQAQADSSGKWVLEAGNLSGSFKIWFRLDNEYWAFRNPEGNLEYAWEGPSVNLPSPGSISAGVLQPDPNSENSKVGWIHLTYLEALDLFQRSQTGLGWWRRTITVVWPSQADYFQPGWWRVHLTRPHAWDVNLHELGHAVMALGMRIRPAGGAHKIDECYSAALAWSEGFATFFAGAAHLSWSDPDAKFEFLVPRRAPIRIENVPEDVCRGQTNEWRVAAAVWDLLDINPDGQDRIAVEFKRLWGSLEMQSMGSMLEAWELLKEKLTPQEIQAGELALNQNTIEIRRKAPSIPRIALPPLALPELPRIHW